MPRKKTPTEDLSTTIEEAESQSPTKSEPPPARSSKAKAVGTPPPRQASAKALGPKRTLDSAGLDEPLNADQPSQPDASDEPQLLKATLAKRRPAISRRKSSDAKETDVAIEAPPEKSGKTRRRGKPSEPILPDDAPFELVAEEPRRARSSRKPKD